MATANRLIFDLMVPSTAVSQHRLDALGPHDWEAFRYLSALHRLQPWLDHVLRTRRPGLKLPASVTDYLRASRIEQTGRALKIRALLTRLSALFETADMPWRALKGAYLAFHVYPSIELRPLRDLDILVPEDRALEAFDLLLANGAERSSLDPGDPAAFLATHQKHLPAITFAREDVRVEVHARLVKQSSHSPALAGDAVLPAPALRVGGDPVPFLDPELLLLHLVVHAAYEHKFDNGPLTFVDIEHLLSTTRLDWPRFWSLCAAGGHIRGAILTLRISELVAGRQLFEHALRDELSDAWLSSIVAALTRTNGDSADQALARRFSKGKANWDNWRFIGRRLFRTRTELVSEFGDDGASYAALYLRLSSRLARRRLPMLVRFMRTGKASEATQAMQAITTWLDAPA